MASVMLFTNRNCGWAVRNYAALIEKNVDFETCPAVDTSGDKSREFLKLTPYGKTPVLVYGDHAVFESMLINEYIDERFPDPPLMPESAAERSNVRKWIHFCEHRLLPMLTTIARAEDTNGRQLAMNRFEEDARWFGRNVLSQNWQGPYLLGDRFSLADLCFATLFRTIETLTEPKLSLGHPALQDWADNILLRPSIVRAHEIQRGLQF